MDQRKIDANRKDACAGHKRPQTDAAAAKCTLAIMPVWKEWSALVGTQIQMVDAAIQPPLQRYFRELGASTQAHRGFHRLNHATQRACRHCLLDFRAAGWTSVCLRSVQRLEQAVGAEDMTTVSFHGSVQPLQADRACQLLLHYVHSLYLPNFEPLHLCALPVVVDHGNVRECCREVQANPAFGDSEQIWWGGSAADVVAWPT